MKNLFALIAVFCLSAVFTPVFGALSMPLIGLGSLIVGGGTVNAGLNKELWLPTILEGFYADDMFLSECRDLSPFVDNDILNLAEAGVDPDVLINNTTYPIDIAERSDAPLSLEIDQFDTENTMLKHADKAELSYDKLASITLGHKNALRMKIMEKGLHAIAPAADGEFTPLLETTGIDNGSGNKAMKWKDVRDLQLAFDQAEMTSEGRIIILSQQHLADLETEDLDRFNKVMDKGEICGFKIYKLADKRLPRYNKTTGAKVAFGAAAAPSTDVHATVAFQKDEVGRAMGTTDMFFSKAENDPIHRRDVIGFMQRAMVLPIRNKGVAAIYSPVAA